MKQWIASTLQMDFQNSIKRIVYMFTVFALMVSLVNVRVHAYVASNEEYKELEVMNVLSDSIVTVNEEEVANGRAKEEGESVNYYHFVAIGFLIVTIVLAYFYVRKTVED